MLDKLERKFELTEKGKRYAELVELEKYYASETHGLGNKIRIECSDLYVKVTAGRMTHYFNAETGEYDGNSCDVSKMK